MRFFIGMVVVMGCILGAFVGMGGNLMALYQPGELVIIGGAALGAFVVGNPKYVLLGSLRNARTVLKGMPYNKEAYLEVLMFLLNALKMIRSKGLLSIEGDVDNPENSEMFNKYPKFAKNHHAVSFFCDYIRIMNMGIENFYQLEDLMVNELEVHHHEENTINSAIRDLADGLPAIGIVAAVLGVIKTMASISEPPEVLGKLIGGALVGTFLGVLLAYGVVGPMYAYMTKYSEAKSGYIGCIKSALLAHVQGHAPAVAVEIARKTIAEAVRPTFFEVEDSMNKSNE